MDNLDYYVNMASNGDRQAFEELYRQTYYIVYYTCINLLKNEQDALDVTQDVYVTVMNHIQTLEDKSKFMPWLNRIAVNKCKDFLKKNRPVLMDVEYMENPPLEENESFLPEEYVINQTKRQLVLNIMRTALSEKECQTILMYYFNGLSVQEIADVMECPPGTVMYRLSAARGKIKQGVLSYENKTGDRLYGFAAVPFLASLFATEVRALGGIDILPQNMAAAGGGAIGSAAIGTGQAGAVATNIGKAGIGVMKKKIIAGIAATVLVVGGAAAIIVNSSRDKDDSDKTSTETEYVEYVTEEYTSEEEEDTEEETEETTEEFAEEPQQNEQSLEVRELKEYTEDRDGKDVISGHIKDIVYEEGFNAALIILADDGHLYSYYNDGLGYYISDLGKPSWEVSDIDTISSDMECESGEVTIIEGNHYYHVEVDNCQATEIVDSVMLEGKEIREIGINSTYGDGFYVYCEDGSYYCVRVNKDGREEGPFIDSQSYLIDGTGSLINIVPEGLEMMERSGEYALCSDGKLYFHASGSSAMETTPIEGTADYTFTGLYNPYMFGDVMTAAVTDTNELLIVENEDAEILYTIALPEAEILDLWYNNGTVVVKTTDGYYSCNPEENTVLEPDEIFNALTEEVVEIYGSYVLLSDGYVYEFPY